jgi:WD40 repeat protein
MDKPDRARLWDRQGNELAVLRGHENYIRSAVFSPDGQTILTASEDGTARLWPNYTVEYMVQEAYWRIKRGDQRSGALAIFPG